MRLMEAIAAPRNGTLGVSAPFTTSGRCGRWSSRPRIHPSQAGRRSARTRSRASFPRRSCEYCAGLAETRSRCSVCLVLLPGHQLPLIGCESMSATSYRFVQSNTRILDLGTCARSIFVRIRKSLANLLSSSGKYDGESACVSRMIGWSGGLVVLPTISTRKSRPSDCSCARRLRTPISSRLEVARARAAPGVLRVLTAASSRPRASAASRGIRRWPGATAAPLVVPPRPALASARG